MRLSLSARGLYSLHISDSLNPRPTDLNFIGPSFFRRLAPQEGNRSQVMRLL
jgi:hypothetical protein